MSKKLNWGILGTGHIAKAFAHGLQHSKTGRLVAVGSRSQATADAFADAFSVARRHAGYDKVLGDPEVEAVYIALPHSAHAEWSIRAARRGKHILCEKPAALNHGDAMAAIEAARQAGVFWMEALMYRCHPQTHKLVELVREGAIGDVRVIQAAFSFKTTSGPEGRLLNSKLGGGGILDVGCYPVSMARLIAGAASGRAFQEPVEVVGRGHVGEVNGIDEWAAAILRFPNDVIAQITAGVGVTQDNTVRVYGTNGWMHVTSPWQPAKLGGEWSFVLHRAGSASPETISGVEPRNLYAVEADHVASRIDEREAAPPAMTWNDTLGNMRVLDLWREQVGVVYESERPEKDPPPITRRKPVPVAGHRMKFGRIEGVKKPISRLVMGVDNQRNYPHAAVMFDDFIEKSGNAFDTAWIYGAGQFERLFGHWVRNRGLRDDVVIIGKGAHTPMCDPFNLKRQLHESLDRLGTDHVDIYLLHRDNPEVPVGEFVDVLNRHVREGLIGIFGGSNWTVARIEEANRYAAANQLQGFSALSNNLSLARMVDEPWQGCVTASDPASRAWLESNQFPLFAWSSQARGFFTDRAGPDKCEDAELVRCWFAEDNFQRRERATELARARGVLPINIALAYVLRLPFPTFTLIGPRTLDETRTSLPALDVELTPGEVRWLNLEE